MRTLTPVLSSKVIDILNKCESLPESLGANVAIHHGMPCHNGDFVNGIARRITRKLCKGDTCKILCSLGW